MILNFLNPLANRKKSAKSRNLLSRMKSILEIDLNDGRRFLKFYPVKQQALS